MASNKFRHDVMLKFGWTLLGTANEVIDLPIEDAKPPRVYARIMGQIE